MGDVGARYFLDCNDYANAMLVLPLIFPAQSYDINTQKPGLVRRICIPRHPSDVCVGALPGTARFGRERLPYICKVFLG